MKLLKILFSLVSAAAPIIAADADLILYNGNVITVDKSFSLQQAVVISGGRIVAVGRSADLLTRRTPHTQMIDLKGRTVLPGLIDEHVHALWAGLSEYREPLPELHSFADIQHYIKVQAAKTPKGKWIVIPRTFPTRLREMRMPTRELLDVDLDHPVLFDASYVSIVNTTALRMSGITSKTPNPPQGQIAKDKSGEPNGILRNATSLLKDLPNVESDAPFTETEKLDALEKMLRRYAAAGLTTVEDRAVLKPEVDVYEKLKSQGRLPIRTVLTWRMNTNPPTDQLVREIQNSPWVTNKGDAWLKFGSFKVTLDGGMTIGTAYQRQPYGPFGAQLYGQDDAASRGQLFVPPDKLLAVMRAARDKGWALSAHSQGGGAVDVLLDVFDKLNRERPIAPSRSHWIHASFQSPEAIARGAKLGIGADVQTYWLYFDGDALQKVFGYDGMRYFIPLRSYLNAGVPISGGSDHMIGWNKNSATNPYNPFLGMWIAIARKTKTGKVIYPEERLTREEALKLFTIWPAYLQFNEKDRGSVEVGKLADLVVIDRDFLKCPEDQIKLIEPVLTIVNGKTVYSRGDHL